MIFSPRHLLISLIFSLVSLWGTQAAADVFQPAYLEVREANDDRYEVLLRTPTRDTRSRLALDVQFPEDAEIEGAISRAHSQGALIERYRLRIPGGLFGKSVRLSGEAAPLVEVVARIEHKNGTSQVERLARGTHSFTVRAPEQTASIAWSYLVLGMEHILLGIDHLLFVLSLLLVVRGTRKILATITAFTLAHSVTLVLSSLGLVQVPGPPVEAIIALSIVFVAAEGISERQGRPGLTSRAPWLVALTFGLLHGLGFAGALAEIGLPQHAIPLALLTFNIGVEVGQAAFVVAMLGCLSLVGRLSQPEGWSAKLDPITTSAYAIGTIASFWVFERVAAFWA